ncbi:MAG: hypothetical protein ABIL68_03350 [bacterium]
MRRQSYPINMKRVERLMKTMGITTVYPLKLTSRRHPEKKINPYLLRNLAFTWPDQAWSVDLVHIRLIHAFVFLIAIMDWFSRYVLSWSFPFIWE